MNKVTQISPDGVETRLRRSRGQIIRRDLSKVKVRYWEHEWYPLIVQSQKEGVAELQLADRGFATFLPLRVKSQHRNQVARVRCVRQPVVYPWLPGLLFVGFTPGVGQQWHHVSAVPQVQNVLSLTNLARAPMRHGAIWRLMLRYGRGRFVSPTDQPEAARPVFAAGERVDVIDGPLDGQRLTIRKIKGKYAECFVRIMGKDCGFDVALDKLEKVA